MSHRAALYTVRVKKTYKQEFRLLGDITGKGGIYLGDVLGGYLNGFAEPNQDGTKVVRCTSVTVNGDEVALALEHGENGIAATIVDANGTQTYRQKSSDTQLLGCGGLFVLPRAEDTGWLALHVAHGRGVKGLLETGLLKQFAAGFDRLRLEINPFVESGVLEAAVEKGMVNNVRLTKAFAPDDRAVAVAARWLPPQEWGQMEVRIKPKGRALHVLPGLLRQYFKGDSAKKAEVFQSIVEFNGMEFDEAKVEVELENDVKRTFNIERPDSGHPLTLDLDPEELGLDADGEPDQAKLIAALRAALTSVL